MSCRSWAALAAILILRRWGHRLPNGERRVVSLEHVSLSPYLDGRRYRSYQGTEGRQARTNAYSAGSARCLTRYSTQAGVYVYCSKVEL